MKIVKGDLITLAQAGEFDTIVHGCNCEQTMGGGIALQLKNIYPALQTTDQLFKPTNPIDRLGQISIYDTPDNFRIVNAYTQLTPGRRAPYEEGVYVDYCAIRLAFQKVKFWYGDSHIAFPMIGAGLAGGDWDKIADIISEELSGSMHTLVIYNG